MRPWRLSTGDLFTAPRHETVKPYLRPELSNIDLPSMVRAAREQHPDQIDRVLMEISRLRALKRPRNLEAPIFAQFRSLIALCPDTQPSSALAWCKYTARYLAVQSSNKTLLAAYWVLFGEGETVADRLKRYTDVSPRTLRRWSDDGLPLLAAALVDVSTFLPGLSIPATRIDITESAKDSFRIQLVTRFWNPQWNRNVLRAHWSVPGIDWPSMDGPSVDIGRSLWQERGPSKITRTLDFTVDLRRPELRQGTREFFVEMDWGPRVRARLIPRLPSSDWQVSCMTLDHMIFFNFRPMTMGNPA